MVLAVLPEAGWIFAVLGIRMAFGWMAAFGTTDGSFLFFTGVLPIEKTKQLNAKVVSNIQLKNKK